MNHGILSAFILQLMAVGRCQCSRECAAGGTRMNAAGGFATWEDEGAASIIRRRAGAGRSNGRISHWFASARLWRARST
jgi:hypothetical protein